MKRFLALTTAIIMAIGMASCGSKSESDSKEKKEEVTTTPITTVTEEETTTETISPPETTTTTTTKKTTTTKITTESKVVADNIKIDKNEYVFADYEKYNVNGFDAEMLDGDMIYITGTIKKYLDNGSNHYALIKTDNGEWYVNLSLWDTEPYRTVKDVYDNFPEGTKNCTILGSYDGDNRDREDLKKPIISCSIIQYDGETYDYDSFYHEDTRTTGQIQALSTAKSYLRSSPFSHSGLIGQLEYEGFTYDEAVYGADNCGADWYEQAIKKAESYLRSSSFSYSGLIEQLEYEGFTYDEAVYGADNCGADWYEQAAKKAESYLRSSSFSREELIDQLLYEGFAAEEAEYGVQSVGY